MPTLVSRLYDLQQAYGLTARETDRLTRHVATYWKRVGKCIDRDNSTATTYLVGLVEDIMRMTGWDTSTACRFVGHATVARAERAVKYVEMSG